MRYAKAKAIALALAVSAAVGTGCTSVTAEVDPGAGEVDFDPNYQPREGDRAILVAREGNAVLETVPILGDMTAFDKYERAKKAKASLEIQDLEERGWLKWTHPGTRILIKTIRDRTHLGARVAAEVRLLDGPYKDTTAWTPISYITRFVDVEKP
jgi:hypothetical protein